QCDCPFPDAVLRPGVADDGITCAAKRGRIDDHQIADCHLATLGQPDCALGENGSVERQAVEIAVLVAFGPGGIHDKGGLGHEVPAIGARSDRAWYASTKAFIKAPGYDVVRLDAGMTIGIVASIPGRREGVYPAHEAGALPGFAVDPLAPRIPNSRHAIAHV